jgi:hypothetical protein
MSDNAHYITFRRQTVPIGPVVRPVVGNPLPGSHRRERSGRFSRVRRQSKRIVMVGAETTSRIDATVQRQESGLFKEAMPRAIASSLRSGARPIGRRIRDSWISSIHV